MTKYLLILQEVKDTLDKVAILQLMQECYEVHEPDKKKIAELKSIMLDEPVAHKSKIKSFSKIGGSILQKVKVCYMVTFISSIINA